MQHQIIRVLNVLGLYRCTCGATGDLSWVAEHVVKNQYEVKPNVPRGE